MSSRLTAMDIENQDFTRKMRGYDVDEVRMYLRSVAEEIERVNLENGRMLEETGQLRQQLAELRSRERVLQDTLVSAQTMAADIQDKARREGELLIQEARLRGDELLQQSREEMTRIELEISRLRLERESFDARLRGLLDEHHRLLDMRVENKSQGERDKLRVLPRVSGSDFG